MTWTTRTPVTVVNPGSATSVDITMPSGLTAGDMLVVVVRFSVASGTRTFTGWTQTPLSAYSARTYVYYRRADGTEGASETLSWVNSANIILVCLAFRQADGHLVSFDQEATESGSTGTSHETPSITAGASSDGGYYLGIFSDNAGAAVTAVSTTGTEALDGQIGTTQWLYVNRTSISGFASATRTITSSISIGPDSDSLVCFISTAPIVSVPTQASLVLTGIAPVVTVSNHQTLAPANASLVLTGVAPVVTATAHQTISPDPTILTLTGVAPAVTVGATLLLIPDPAVLVLTGIAPVVQAGESPTDGWAGYPGSARLSPSGAAGGAVVATRGPGGTARLSAPAAPGSARREV
jgi:hypothetical protein